MSSSKAENKASRLHGNTCILSTESDFQGILANWHILDHSRFRRGCLNDDKRVTEPEGVDVPCEYREAQSIITRLARCAKEESFFFVGYCPRFVHFAENDGADFKVLS